MKTVLGSSKTFTVNRQGLKSSGSRRVKLCFRLYGGCIETVDIDLKRFNLFSKARKGLELLPPTKDAFELHCLRADYQAKIRLNAFNAEMDVGIATNTDGWKLGQNGIEIVWSRLSAVPTACMKLTTYVVTWLQNKVQHCQV